jgi:protein unc-80
VSVNIHGNDCPPALKLVAVFVLLEITAFLRESYQTIPKLSRMSHKEKHVIAPWDHHPNYKDANRRWSMALSSMGHSQTSAQSLQSIAGEGERKISFVLHEPDNESEGSSNTTLTMQGEETAMSKYNKEFKILLFFFIVKNYKSCFGISFVDENSSVGFSFFKNFEE